MCKSRMSLFAPVVALSMNDLSYLSEAVRSTIIEVASAWMTMSHPCNRWMKQQCHVFKVWKLFFFFSCMSNVIVMCLQYCKGLSIKLYSGILVMDIRYTAVMECDWVHFWGILKYFHVLLLCKYWTLTLYSLLHVFDHMQTACCNIAKTEKNTDSDSDDEYWIWISATIVKPIVYSIYCTYKDVCVLLATYLHDVLTTSNLWFKYYSYSWVCTSYSGALIRT